jgi:HEAT repeat protein
MEIRQIIIYLQNLSQQAIIGAVLILLVLIGAVVWHILARRRFSRLLERAAAEDRTAAREVYERYATITLQLWTGMIERRARSLGSGFLYPTGIADFWIGQLYRRPSRRALQRVLEFVPDKGLFTAFRVALRRRSIGSELLAWLDATEDIFVYRRMALSGKGESFDGAAARELFAERMEHIREMTGDPEWPARYMAVKILLYDDDERSQRAVREMFHDPHPLIRRTLIEELLPRDKDEEEEFYQRLAAYLTDDSAYEVRRAAKNRIRKDFAGRYELEVSSLSDEQALHVLEQLDPDSTEDINLALTYLEGKNLELRFAAAQFLERTNRLTELLLDVGFTDRTELERNRTLLHNAAEVNILGFLQAIRRSTNPAAISIALGILRYKGDESLITVLAEEVFSRQIDLPDEQRLLVQALRCIHDRGTAEAVKLLGRELLSRRYQGEIAELLLDHLPPAYEGHTVPVLVKLLRDPLFAMQEKLHEVFLKFDPSLYLDELFRILKAGREEYSHSVRISALLLLGKLKLTYCMQFILEQMPVLPFSEARDFSEHLHDYAGKLFTQRVMSMLEKDDGKVRAALISSIPATGIKEFVKPIREAVGDADPEVRRASVWALLEYGDQKSVRTALDLIRDPVERVRTEASRALASRGTPSVLQSFSELLADENEVETVKQAALEGLAASAQPESVDILVDTLRDRPEELGEPATDALARKRELKQVKRIVEQLKDANPQLREAIIGVFQQMGEAAEAPLVELLHEDIPSLLPHLSGVLEATGYVEHAVRQLNHRDPRVRREAADNLSRIGTTSAFRGMVLASRDPDDEVRVKVTRALERLNSESGNEILEELKNDPDKRIRKYTLWALERITAKNNE